MSKTTRPNPYVPDPETAEWLEWREGCDMRSSTAIKSDLMICNLGRRECRSPKTCFAWKVIQFARRNSP